MRRAAILKSLIEKTGLSLKAFSEKVNIPYTTLYSILERGVSKASVDNIIKICRTLGITTEDLESMTENTEQLETFAANRTDEYDYDLPEEAKVELKNFIEYLKVKYKKKDNK